MGALVIKIDLKPGLSLYNSLQLAYNWPWKRAANGIRYRFSKLAGAQTRRAENMANFEEMLRTELDRQIERRLVVAVAIKDAESPLHTLGSDLLRLVGQQLWHPAILRWEDVMREYMEAESKPLVL